jgi:hypothetical protein
MGLMAMLVGEVEGAETRANGSDAILQYVGKFPARTLPGVNVYS